MILLNALLAETGSFIASKSMSRIEYAMRENFKALMSRFRQEVSAKIKGGWVDPSLMEQWFKRHLPELRENLRKTYGAMLDEQIDNEKLRALMADRVFEASERTLNAVKDNVLDKLGEAISGDYADMREAVGSAIDGLLDYELDRIARTENKKFFGEVNFARLQHAGVKYHQWITANDERVRDEHLAMHGEIVPVGTRFSNGLLHAGDTSTGDVEQFINCRCTTVAYFVPDGYMFIGEPPYTEDDLVPIGQEELTQAEDITAEVMARGEHIRGVRTVSDFIEVHGRKPTSEEFVELIKRETERRYQKALPEDENSWGVFQKAISQYVDYGFNRETALIEQGRESELLERWASLSPEKRQEIIQEYHDTLKGLNRIADSVASYEGKLYRGMSFTDENLEKFLNTLEVGGIFEIQNYTSTSQDYKVAEHFTTKWSEELVTIRCLWSSTRAVAWIFCH